MPFLVQLSTFLGAAVLVFTTFCLAAPARRALGVVVGSVGIVAGGAAALLYTLFHALRGVDLDLIPHEPAAQWFVAAFGWSGLAAALLVSFVPDLRARVRRARLRRL